MRLRSAYPVPLFLSAALLSMFPIVRDPQQVLLWRGGAFSDLLISHWPNALFVRRAIATWGELPLWNPMALSGAPLAADPLAGIWYPPNWLAILLPQPLGFNLLSWLHLGLAGVGSWKLARRLGLSHGAAVVTGLAFSATPKLLGHLGLGHVSLVYAACWTPWSLLAADRAARRVGADRRRGLAAAAQAGALTGLVFLADPRWYPGLMLLTGAFFLWRLARRAGLRVALGWAIPAAAVGGAVSLAIAAVLAVPLAEFIGLSTRSGLELSESAALSLPIDRLTGVLAPELGAWPEWQPYAGSVVLLLAGVSLIAWARGARFWMAVLLIALLVAIGDATPLYAALRTVVPGFSQLRVPPRGLLLAALAWGMLAGIGFDRLQRVPLRRLRLLAAALFALYAVVGAATWLGSAGQLPQERIIRVVPWLLSGATIGIAGVWTASRIGRRRSQGAFVLFLAALLLMDLSLVNLTTLRAEAVPIDPVAQLAGNYVEPGQRVFSPSYSLRQPDAAELGLETADGVNPLQLASYVEFMRGAIGVRDAGYSVTLPPFAGGSIDEPWGFEPDPGKLGLLAVAEVVSAYPVEGFGLQLLEIAHGQHFYRNPAARPRAWVEAGDGLLPAEIVAWSPNSIVLVAQGEGRLVLSEVAYPGWSATVDGAAVQIDTYAGLLRAVDLEAGEHTVVFEFRPTSVRAGAALGSLGLLIVLSLWIRP